MISFSKSKFLVLGFVFAAVLLVPVDDAFAFSITLIDDFHMNLSKYTISGYEDDRLYYHSLQKDGSPHSTGTSRSHDGWSSPNSLPDGILPGSYTWTWFSDNARTNQIAQVSWVRDIPNVIITTLEPESKYGRDGYHLSGNSNVGGAALPFSICQEPPCDSSINGHYRDSINTDANGTFDDYRDANFPLIGTWYVTVGTDTKELVFQEMINATNTAVDANPPVITLTGGNWHVDVGSDGQSLIATGVGFQHGDLPGGITVMSPGLLNGWDSYDSVGWSDFAYWPDSIYHFGIDVNPHTGITDAPICHINNSISTNLEFDYTNAVDRINDNTWHYFSYFPIGTSEIHCTVTNQDGATGMLDFTFTVDDPTPADTTPPIITVPNNIIASATLAGNQVVPLNVTATDNVEIAGNINGQPYPYCTIPELASLGSGLSMTPSNMVIGMEFQIGTTTVICNVSDTSGNQSTASFTVTVIEDTDNVPTIPSSVTVTVPSNQVITTTNSSHAFTYAFSPVSSLGPKTSNNGVVCDYVPQSDTGLSLGQYNLYYYPDGESFYEKHGNIFSQQWESNGRYVDGNWIDDDTHFRTFPEGTTTVTCGSIVVDGNGSWQESAFSLWYDQMYRADDWMGGPTGPFQKFPVSSLNGTSSFDITVIFDDGNTDNVPTIPSSVTVTVPSNQVITTTNSSHAFTYAFSTTNSLGPESGNHATVCEYVPQSNTGLSLGQHNQYYYPDGESFYEKHGSYFGQEFESDWKGEHYSLLGMLVPGETADDITHSKTFPEGTTKVTCGSVVVDRSSSWAAHGLWLDGINYIPGGVGRTYDIPITSLNGTSSFDVTVIFDDGITSESTPSADHTIGAVVGDVDAEESITIQTDSTTYVEGSHITVSGNVSKIIGDTIVTLQLFKDGNLVEIDQIPVSADGNYSHTLIAEGSLWENSGEYLAKVTYGEGNVADTLFDYTSETLVNIDTIPPTLSQNQNITVDATTSSNGAIVNYELPQVTDYNSGVDLGPTCIPGPGSFFPIGTTYVNCSASDWAGNVGTTSFTVFVESQIVAPVEIMTDVTLEIGQSQYTTDDSIFVTGVATPFTENNISIQVEDTLENIVLVEQITPESSGVYTGIISPNFLWNTSGNYTMSVTYGNSTSNTSFGFEFVEPVIDESMSATGITLATDASQYFIGDMIVIESALTDVGSGNEIHIFITDPNGNNVSIQSLNTDDSGFAILLLRVQDNWIPGEYSIRVMDWNSDLEETMTIDIVKPLPEITLSPTMITTEDGNSITSYDAGDMAYFATSLLSESTSDVLVTVNVVDADDTTLGVAFFKSIVGKGDSELVLGFKIPEDAADGAAKIYVNTYTDWIDQGGVVIGSELLSEVNINGVIIEEPVVVEPVVEETVLSENTIPRLSSVSDIVQPASFTTGSIVSYTLPLATSGTTILSPTCTPAPGSLFPIGSTQVTCTATNAVGNTGMTSFMVTINPIAQVADQTLTVKVGKDSYNNLEPIFVTGSVGKVTSDPVNLEVRDTQNNLISIEQVSPKETGVYTVVLTSNELWNSSGEYHVIANYGDVIALDEFVFELEEVEEIIPEKIPTSLVIDTLDSAYVLGDVVAIGVNLVDAGAGEPILLEVRDSNNDQVILQSLNTDSDGVVVFFYQLDSTGESGVYSVTATSDEWSFSNSQNLVVVPQIPDITIGDVVSTLQDGTAVDSFESGDMGYFQTPVISESVSDVLITVNIFDVENTPIGLAHFNSMVVDETFDIVLGLQIPQDAVPGLATVYINTYTDWPNEGGVPILEEQVSFIEISPASTTSLTVSSEEPKLVTTPELVPVSSNISVQTGFASYVAGKSIAISGTVENLTEFEQPVIIMIVSPAGNFVYIDQVLTDSSGNYSTTVNSGGKSMSSNGEYEVHAHYGAHKITTTFDFTRN